MGNTQFKDPVRTRSEAEVDAMRTLAFVMESRSRVRKKMEFSVKKLLEVHPRAGSTSGKLGHTKEVMSTRLSDIIIPQETLVKTESSSGQSQSSDLETRLIEKSTSD